MQLRSLAESVQSKTRGNSLEGKPQGLPQGFFPDFDAALAEVKRWALNTATGGGAWGVIRGRSNPPSLTQGRQRGAIKYMQCEFKDPPKEPSPRSLKERN